MRAGFLRGRVEVVLVGVMLLAGFGVYRANLALEAEKVSRSASGEIGPLPDGKALRVLSLGFERLVADLFWVRTVYYVGGEAAQDENYPAAEGLAQLVTDIDPYFDSVYVLMSAVLSGLRYEPDAAIALLEKGAQYSDYWRIHFLLGFQYFMEKGDYATGARHIEEAARLGGPTYLPLLASRLYAHGGEDSTAMMFLQARLRNESHPKIRRQLQRRLNDVWINRDLKILRKAIARYRESEGGDPRAVAQLLAAGLIKKEPLDPAGQPYAIEAGEPTASMKYEELRVRD